MATRSRQTANMRKPYTYLEAGDRCPRSVWQLARDAARNGQRETVNVSEPSITVQDKLDRANNRRALRRIRIIRRGIELNVR